MEGVPLSLPLELGVTEALAPVDSNALGEALRLALREVEALGVGAGVPVPVTEPVPVPELEGV